MRPQRLNHSEPAVFEEWCSWCAALLASPEPQNPALSFVIRTQLGHLTSKCFDKSIITKTKTRRFFGKNRKYWYTAWLKIGLVPFVHKTSLQSLWANSPFSVLNPAIARGQGAWPLLLFDSGHRSQCWQSHFLSTGPKEGLTFSWKARPRPTAGIRPGDFHKLKPFPVSLGNHLQPEAFWNLFCLFSMDGYSFTEALTVRKKLTVWQAEPVPGFICI